MKNKLDDKNLEVIEELVGLHSMNPFIREVSSSRGYMESTHFSQSCTPIFGEEKIIQTGLEKQFGRNTHSKKTESDVRVIAIIKRYSGIGEDSVDKVVEHLVITQDVITGEVDFISIPYYNKLHIDFGFKYELKDELLNLRPGDVLPKDTILADSPAVSKNSGYKYGVNANVCLINLPETAEDGVIISQNLAEKLTYRSYETRAIEFGSKAFPLNIYGDDKVYKPFPEIGEKVGEKVILCALRDYDTGLSTALTSFNDVRDFNPMFDKAMYVKGPGKDIKIRGQEFTTGRVVDVKVYTNPKYKKEVYSGVSGYVDRYANALKKYYKDILDVYENIKKEHYGWNKNTNVLLSNKFHRLIIDAMALAGNDSKRINYSSRNEVMDLYRVEITVEYIGLGSNGTLNISNKISDSHGSKGVIVQIKPNHEMPYIEANGDRIYADVVMDPAAVTSRMNPGRIFEQYFNGMSRKTQYEMRKILHFKPFEQCKDKEIEEAFNILLGLLKIIGTEQYEEYRQLTDKQLIKEIVRECVEEEVYILYRVSSVKRPSEIIIESQNTIYAPTMNSVKLKIDGKEVDTNYQTIIAPIYTIILDKTGETFLSTASSKINHFGIPVGVNASNKYSYPWRNSSTRIVSETEKRLFTAYTGTKFSAELSDRASNIETHKIIYKNILDAPIPTNIDNVIDRTKHEIGETAPMEIVYNLINSAGLDIIEVDEKKVK